MAVVDRCQARAQLYEARHASFAGRAELATARVGHAQSATVDVTCPTIAAGETKKAIASNQNRLHVLHGTSRPARPIKRAKTLRVGGITLAMNHESLFGRIAKLR